jgi:glycosyltransferase involved in cell wall biosynthesis
MIQSHPRPRILIFSTAYLPHIGGSELAIQHIAERIEGFDIDLVTGKLDGSDATMEQMGRIRVFRAGGRWSRLTLVLPKLLMPLAMAVTALRLTRKHSYALIHAYQASQAAVAASIVKTIHPSLPFILTLQEGKDLTRQSWLTQSIRKLIIRRADSITAISTYLGTIARAYTSAPIRIIPNGVDIKAMQLPDVPRAPHTVMTVSRLVEKNNVANLIRAIAIVRDTLPDVRLVIIGSGRLRSELERCASDAGIAAVVEFVGSVPHPQLGAYLASAGVFARPSLSEGLGSAFLEAMGARVPVVASAVGGIPDIVHEGRTGLLCDPKSPEDIARAISKLMTNQELRERIVAGAYEFVHRYDWSVIAKDMAEVYDSSIHRH